MFRLERTNLSLGGALWSDWSESYLLGFIKLLWSYTDLYHVKVYRLLTVPSSGSRNSLLGLPLAFWRRWVDCCQRFNLLILVGLLYLPIFVQDLVFSCFCRAFSESFRVYTALDCVLFGKFCVGPHGNSEPRILVLLIGVFVLEDLSGRCLVLDARLRPEKVFNVQGVVLTNRS